MGRYEWIATNQKAVMISKGPFEDPCIYQYLPGLPKFFIGTYTMACTRHIPWIPLFIFLSSLLYHPIFSLLFTSSFYIGLEVKSNNNLANNKILVDEMVTAVGKILTAVDEILAIHRSTPICL